MVNMAMNQRGAESHFHTLSSTSEMFVNFVRWGGGERISFRHCLTNDGHHEEVSFLPTGEIPSKDDIAEMEGRAVRWMSAVADTI